MSKIKVNEIEAQTGSTITIPTGQSLVVTDGIGTSSLPTVPVTKGGTGLTSLGTAGQVLKVNSGATALEYGADVGGKILQVISTSKADVWTATTGSTPTDVTGFNATITPSSASNKVLVLVNFTHSTTGANATGSALLLRGTTPISKGTTAGSRAQAFAWSGQYGATWHGINVSTTYLDSPATTSATTYKIQIVSEQTSVVGATSRDIDDPYHGRYASNITLMEIGG
jgi:trimeric autotransporter adhesin